MKVTVKTKHQKDEPLQPGLYQTYAGDYYLVIRDEESNKNIVAYIGNDCISIHKNYQKYIKNREVQFISNDLEIIAK